MEKHSNNRGTFETKQIKGFFWTDTLYANICVAAVI